MSTRLLLVIASAMVLSPLLTPRSPAACSATARPVPLALVASALLLNDAGDEPELPTPAGNSRITEVVVFPSHAEITRELVVDAVDGANHVEFLDLIPTLHAASLRASASEGARITGTELRTTHLETSFSAEIQQLEARILELGDQIEVKTRALKRVSERTSVYTSIKSRMLGDVGHEFHDGRVSVSSWEEVLQFVSSGLEACDADRRALELDKRALETERAAVVAERKDYAGRQAKEGRVAEVAFLSEGAGERAIRIHYLIDSATWKPSYDVHLQRDDARIEIVAYGQIVQWSGESWDDVQLTLAMSRPDVELALPELKPMIASLDDGGMKQLASSVRQLNAISHGEARAWTLQHFQKAQDRETFRRNLEHLSQLSLQNLQRYGLNRAIVQGALARLVDRFATVRYAVDGRVSIPYNSAPHKVVTFAASVPAELRYVATPALGNAVLLRGAGRNVTGFPIVEGAASLFSDGSYIGASNVTNAAANEEFSFAFGPDDGLTVERQLVNRGEKGPEWFRSSQLITYEYRISVENFRDQQVSVEVSDQIPVSQSDEIEVKFLGSEGAEVEFPQVGLLRWTLVLPAGSRRTLAYSFRVEIPEDREVHWK